jgi:hypothetical protein
VKADLRVALQGLSIIGALTGSVNKTPIIEVCAGHVPDRHGHGKVTPSSRMPGVAGVCALHDRVIPLAFTSPESNSPSTGQRLFSRILRMAW